MNQELGLLIINLGTPKEPTPAAVGTYLTEFLTDPYVIDIPTVIRQFLVRFLIVPKRKVTSAERYKSIWTNRGSPLLFNTQDLAQKLRKTVKGFSHIEVAMRYGEPSIEAALQSFGTKKIKDVFIFPLYPQYAQSSVKTSLEQAYKLNRKLKLDLSFHEVDSFFNKPFFINSLKHKVGEFLGKNKVDHLILSYHGLPESHIRKTEGLKNHCLRVDECCMKLSVANRYCYRAHCYHTTRDLASALELAPDFYTMSFQSRLGSAKWLDPSTESVVINLAKAGKKRVAVVCPSFIADCLETLEEVSGELNEVFKAAGGQELILIPCLNSDAPWVAHLSEWLEKQAQRITHRKRFL